MKTRAGINFTHFLCITEDSNLNLHEWSNILHLSKRTMQRYKKENISFSPLQSEIILKVVLIFQKEHDVFGREIEINNWINADNLSFGGSKSKCLLDSTFGIRMIEDELIRIEHGLFT
jgi:putative toxin-antitoxin system antitoxin component (TIGR02293 family)